MGVIRRIIGILVIIYGIIVLLQSIFDIMETGLIFTGTIMQPEDFELLQPIGGFIGIIFSIIVIAIGYAIKGRREQPRFRRSK